MVAFQARDDAHDTAQRDAYCITSAMDEEITEQAPACSSRRALKTCYGSPSIG